MSDTIEATGKVKKEDDSRTFNEIDQDKLVELETAMSGEREQLPGMPKEYSGWDVYNNEARKVDTELVKDWRDSLNSLLLFAAIFAAVLTAFIIESKKLLESDPSDAMLEVMIFFTNSMANGTFTPYSPPQFEPESISITINCLFFASLSASLVAALASVVALQWVADYDAAITRGGSSPEDRAKRRQFRYAEAVRWKMSEIIGALPLLLYTSVVLFFTGLFLWMRNVHHTVGSVIAGGMGIAALFYGVTTFLSVAFVSAPFRTPLSRLIYSFIRFLISIVDSLRRPSPIPSSQTWLKERRLGAVKRDNDEVDRRDSLSVDALSWLVSHLSISLDSYDRLLLLVNELRKQDQKHFNTRRFKQAPWFSIFDLLAWRNFNTAGQDDDISKDEMRAVAILAHCYRIPAIYAIVRPKEEMLYYSDDTADEYWSQGCDMPRAQWTPPSPSTSLNSLFLLLRDIPLPAKDTAKQVELTIRLSRWRNSTEHVQIPSKDAENHVDTLPASSNTSAVVVGRYLKADEDGLWFTRDDRALYQAAVGRMVRLHVESGDKIAPILLDTLHWRFESQLLGEDGDAMNAMPFISRPLLFNEAFKKHKIEYSSLYSNFTLLFARNLNSFSGAERARRVKELLIMMWISSGCLSRYDMIDEGPGWENFFEANRDFLNRWVRHLDEIPHSLEILEHLSLAQAEQPELGSLWRVLTSQATLSSLLLDLGGFDNIIGKGVTTAQHVILIGLVCRDIELSPPGAFRAYLGSRQSRRIKVLQDPCLELIGTVAAGAEIETAEDTNLLKASWIRIAKHLMEHYGDTDLPNTLKLQASAWFLAPEYTQDLCRRTLRESQALARVKRIFEYPVKCHEEGHDIDEGHLLLHILPYITFFTFPANLPALPEFSIEGGYLNSLLAALILSDGYEELLREQMYQQGIDEPCTSQFLEMVNTLLSSQCSMLAILSTIRLSAYSEDLIGFSICVNKALDLPDDPRAASQIPPLVRYVQVQSRKSLKGSLRGQAIAKREATKTIDRLHTYLARLRLSGKRNHQVLSCARASGAFSAAVGWQAPYTD